MSISVELERVQAEAGERSGASFLLTVTENGRPHVVAVSPRWDDGSLVVDAGRSSVRNATDRPAVTLLWPPADPDGYSLILDGEATAIERGEEGGRVTIRPVAAVLHRPGTAGESAGPGCSSDCVPLLRP